MLESLPRRRFADASHKPRLDEHGFLAADAIAMTVHAKDLLAMRSALVLGPPWMGKSTFANRGIACIRNSPSPTAFGSFFHLTTFEQRAICGFQKF